MSTELNTIVQEVVIDDSKAVASSARVVGAMENMAAASDRVTEAGKRQASGFDLLDKATVRLAPAQESAARRLNALRAEVDPTERSLQRLSRAEQDLNRAISQGLSTQEEKTRIIEQLWSKLLGAAEAQEKLNAAIRAQSAQTSFNTQLGVRDDFNTAARGQDVAAFGAELDRLRGKYNPLFVAQQQYIAQLNEIKTAFRVGAIPSVREFDAAIAATKTGFAQQVRDLQAGTTAIQRMGGSYRTSGAIIQQAGFQVGDFAVQLASGQGVIRPFIQQSTQLLQIFGPMGSIIGAGVAIAGAFFVGLTQLGGASEETKDSLDRLREAQKSLNDEIQKGNQTADEARAFTLRQAEAANALARSEIEAAKGIIARREAEIAASTGAEFITGSTAASSKFRADIAAQSERLADLEVDLDQSTLNIKNFSERETDSGKAIRSTTDELRFQNEQLRRVAREQEIFAALKQAGTTIDSKAGEEIAKLAGEHFDLAQAARKTGKSIAELSAANEKNIVSLNEQTISQRLVAEAFGVSTEAGAREEVAQKARLATLGLGVAATDKLTEAELRLAAAQAHAQAQQDLRSAQLNTEIARRKADAARLSDPTLRREAELAIARQEELNRLTVAYKGNIEDVNAALVEFDKQQAFEDQQRFWDDVRQKAEDVSTDIATFLVDGVTRGGEEGFSGLWDTALAGGKRFLADLAAEFLKTKFIMPIVTAFVGSAGLSGLFGIAGSGGGVGTGGSVAGLTQEAGGLNGLFNNLGSVFNTNPLSGVFSSFATSSIGQSFGLSQAVSGGIRGGSFIGGGAGAGNVITGLGSSLSSVLGGGLSGLGIGSLIGSLGIGSSLGSSIGGALGGAIGSIVPGVGTILGSIGGSLIGGLVGSLFGGKKPKDRNVNTPIDLLSGALGGPEFGQGGAAKTPQDIVDASKNLAQTFLDIEKQIIALTGGTAPGNAFVDVGSRRGIVVGIGDGAAFDPALKKDQLGISASFENSQQGAEQALEFLVQELVKQITGIEDENIKKAIAKGGTAEEILANLQLAKQISNIGLSEFVLQASAAFDELIGKFDELKRGAVDLGLATDGLIEAEKAQLQALDVSTRAAFTQRVQDFVGQFLTPLKALQSAVVTDTATLGEKFTEAQASFRNIATRAAEGSEAALSLLSSAGTLYLEFANGVKTQSLDLRNFLKGLSEGDLSTLTPLEKLNAAEANFQTLLSQAEGGDLTKTGDLTKAAEDYLKLAKEFGASGPIFQDAFENVTTSIGDLADQIDAFAGTADPQSVADEIAAAIGPLIDELSTAQEGILAGIQPTLDGLNQNFRDSIDTLRDEGVKTRDILADIANAIAGAATLPAPTPAAPAPAPDIASPTPGLGFGFVPTEPAKKLTSPGLSGFAGGGLVGGIGGASSDSNIALLSRGEYVSTTDTVSRLGVGFFDALNRGAIPVSTARNDNGALAGVFRDELRSLRDAQAGGLGALAGVFRDELRSLREEQKELRREIARNRDFARIQTRN